MDVSTDYQRVLEVLNRISESILEADVPDTVLPRIVREATQLIAADAGTLAIPDDKEHKLEFHACHDNTNGKIESDFSSIGPVETNEGITGKAFTKREMFEVTDEENLDLGEDTVLKNISNECSTILSIPLIAKSKPVGVVNFYFVESVDVRSDNEELLKSIAKQSGVAIRQGRKIQDLQEKNRRLRIRAATDELTGLPNQGKIMNILKEEIERSNRYSRPVSIIMLDIDRFKDINDDYGHPAGNFILKEIADFFREDIRRVDSVGRYGGEEFLFVLPETLEDQAYTLADRVRNNVKDRDFIWKDQVMSITVSCGIAEMVPELEIDSEEFLDRGDRALLVAKREGRDQTVSFTSIG